MVALIILVSFTVLLVLVALAAVYEERPATELKRAARAGENRAHFIYQVTRHGRTSQVLLRLPALFLFACLLVGLFGWLV